MPKRIDSDYVDLQFYIPDVEGFNAREAGLKVGIRIRVIDAYNVSLSVSAQVFGWKVINLGAPVFNIQTRKVVWNAKV